MAEHESLIEHRIHLLPPFLQEVARVAGVNVAVMLARKHGGRKYYFPERLPPNHPLVMLIGRQAAARLCQLYGKEYVSIPAARTYLRWYDARIYKLQGKSNSEIAHRIGVTTKHVSSLLEGFDAAGVDGADLPPEIDRCPGCGRRANVRHIHAPREDAQLAFDWQGE